MRPNVGMDWEKIDAQYWWELQMNASMGGSGLEMDWYYPNAYCGLRC